MNIYVGNLPYKITEQELSDVFAEYGTVNRVAIIKDKETGRSKGFGFVEMDNNKEAEVAIKAIDGKEVMERGLRVNEARPKPERSNNNGGGRPQRRNQHAEAY